MFRYEATIEAHTPTGYYVYYDGWGNKEEVCSPDCFIILELSSWNTLVNHLTKIYSIRYALNFFDLVLLSSFPFLLYPNC